MDPKREWAIIADKHLVAALDIAKQQGWESGIRAIRKARASIRYLLLKRPAQEAQ